MTRHNGYDDHYHGDRRRWHVRKSVDLTTLFALLGLIAGIIWWGAGVQERIAVVEQQQLAIEQRLDRTDHILERELRRIDSRFNRVERMLIEIAEAVGANQQELDFDAPKPFRLPAAYIARSERQEVSFDAVEDVP